MLGKRTLAGPSPPAQDDKLSAQDDKAHLVILRHQQVPKNLTLAGPSPPAQDDKLSAQDDKAHLVILRHQQVPKNLTLAGPSPPAQDDKLSAQDDEVFRLRMTGCPCGSPIPMARKKKLAFLHVGRYNMFPKLKEWKYFVNSLWITC